MPRPRKPVGPVERVIVPMKGQNLLPVAGASVSSEMAAEILAAEVRDFGADSPTGRIALEQLKEGFHRPPARAAGGQRANKFSEIGLRHRHMAYEIVRLAGELGNEDLAVSTVTIAYDVSPQTAQSALEKYRQEASDPVNQHSYCATLKDQKRIS